MLDDTLAAYATTLDIAFGVPPFHLIDKDPSTTLSGWHSRIINLLVVLVGLHLVAIAFYQRAKKNNLMKPACSKNMMKRTNCIIWLA